MFANGIGVVIRCNTNAEQNTNVVFLKVLEMGNIDLNKLAEETADKYEKKGTEFWRGFHAGFIYGFNKCNEDKNIDTEKQRILSILNKYRINGVNFQNEKTPLIHSKNFNDIINEIVNL